MRSSNDKSVSQLTVRIQETETGYVLGSGIIYHNNNLAEKVYVLTAAHVLFKDGELFQELFDSVDIAIYSPTKSNYTNVTCSKEQFFFYKDSDKDVAVIVLESDSVQNICGQLPPINAVKERPATADFFLKGFPNATQGKELDSLRPIWKQEMTAVKKFQLELNADYNDWSTEGFSGSGIFLHDSDQIYLFGIFARFRAEEKGKVIYGQYLETINELLETNFLPTISFTFLATGGLTAEFFKDHVAAAVEDLGPRFNPELNFKLPVSRIFNDISRDGFFRKRLLGCFHKWLLASKHAYRQLSNPLLCEIASEYEALRLLVRSFIGQIDWDGKSVIDIGPLLEKVDELYIKAYSLQGDLYQHQYDQRRKNPASSTAGRYYGAQPLDDEINWIKELVNNGSDLQNGLSDIDLRLVNDPVLIIRGPAGCGKSHLLGDIATDRSLRGYPVLLFLGQHFTIGGSIFENMIRQLGLNISQKLFLESLDHIGEQTGSRLLLMVDAMNEGAGRDLWHPGLAGFIRVLERYKNIALVLTVRDTYYQAVVPEKLRTSNTIRNYLHEGLKADAYGALKYFCLKFGLDQPNFPILTYEFSNPLFLQLVCEGLKASGKTKFPQGFQGFYGLFDFYILSVHQRISGLREEYQLKKKLVGEAIAVFAQETFDMGSRMLPLEHIDKVFSERFPSHRYLLADLLQENVFLRKLVHDYQNDQEVERVYFAFERFGDFFLAQHTVAEKSRDEVIELFSPVGKMGLMVADEYFYDDGLMEAMAVLLPERFGLEIHEVLDWTLSMDSYHWTSFKASIHNWLLDSLKWRTVDSILPEKIVSWLESGHFKWDYDDYLNRLFELCTVPGHPFNSNRILNILSGYTMPARDGFIQLYFYYYSGSENENPSPIKRLIDWAWMPGISSNLDEETAFLTAQGLAWCLGSVMTVLRDQVSKALINLLQQQGNALFRLLERFSTVDDVYIQERLFAICYGSVLRMQDRANIQILAQWVFDNIFKLGAPPAHVLLRDYARGTVEYALHLGLIIKGDTNLIRPPYRADFDIVFPSEADISKFHLESDKPTYSPEQDRIYNLIHFSTISWDFGNKVINTRFGDFAPESFLFDSQYKSYLAGLSRPKREMVRLYYEIYKSWAEFTYKFKVNAGTRNPRHYQAHIVQLVTMRDRIYGHLAEDLSEDELAFISNQLTVHLDNMFSGKGIRGSLDTSGIKRWIVQRAFALGYDIGLHGKFDESKGEYDRYHTGKVERIGKKYQWIAFYEIFGMIADRHKIRRGYSLYNKMVFFKGPWQKYLRDIDPGFITKKEVRSEEEKDSLGVTGPNPVWYFDAGYNYWGQPTDSWVRMLKDLPDPKRVISRIDPNGEEWVFLALDAKWREPVPFGEDQYDRVSKSVDYWITANLVNCSYRDRAMKSLNRKNMFIQGVDLDMNINLFSHENYWSPAALDLGLDSVPWYKIDGCGVRLVRTFENGVGEVSDDASGARYNYFMPSKFIFDGLELSYGDRDGDFLSPDGKLVARATRDSGLLIKKDLLFKFLSNQNLTIVWTLWGEKQAYSSRRSDESARSMLSGAYSIDDHGELYGDLKLKVEEY